MGIFTKIFIFLRSASCPFEEILSHVPSWGSILDVGCGLGTFALLLVRRNPKQNIIGVDPDKIVLL